MLVSIALIVDYSVVDVGKVKGRPTRNLNDRCDLSGACAGLEDVRIHDVRQLFAGLSRFPANEIMTFFADHLTAPYRFAEAG